MNRFVKQFGIIAAIMLCRGSPSSRAHATTLPQSAHFTSFDTKIIFITIDGVRWQEVFQGIDPKLGERVGIPLSTAQQIVPNLYSLAKQGIALGAPEEGPGIFATGPKYVSLPGYTEMLTGAPSTCYSNDCTPFVSETWIDQFNGKPTGVFTSWDRISKLVQDSRCVSETGRSSNDEAPGYPGDANYRPDVFTAARAIDYLIHKKPSFLWIGLGDTDEWAHRHNYRAYIHALRSADNVIGEILNHVDTIPEYKNNTIIAVTTDHGRDDNFADHGGKNSSKVWFFAYGRKIAAKGFVRTNEKRYLRDIAPTLNFAAGIRIDDCDDCGEVMHEILQ